MPRTPLGHDWPEWTDEQLLDLSMAQLPLSIEGTLASRIFRVANMGDVSLEEYREFLDALEAVLG